ncbi:hypothetical protein [Sphingomonas sp. R86521]|uniref:hypothetical protein n=1 Tax=Sphingomonas sp. R86521 TaxID=3093860 RepID=UPI0036D39BD2
MDTRTIRLACATLTMVATGCAQAAPLRSGLYEEMVLSVDASGRLVGRYFMEQGEGVVKRCDFTFVGQVRGGEAAVRVLETAAGPVRHPVGRVTATADGVTLRLPKAGNLPGCGLVIGPMVEEPGGMPLSRTGAGGWTGLAQVRSPRVALRATPDAAPARAYVVRGDVVGVVERRGRYVHILYPSERRKRSEGWVAATDLQPLGQ